MTDFVETVSRETENGRDSLLRFSMSYSFKLGLPAVLEGVFIKKSDVLSATLERKHLHKTMQIWKEVVNFQRLFRIWLSKCD